MANKNDISSRSRLHVMAKPIGPLCNLDCSYASICINRICLRPKTICSLLEQVLTGNFSSKYSFFSRNKKR